MAKVNKAREAKYTELKIINSCGIKSFHYRGFEYTKEAKKGFKLMGLNIKKCIDEFLENGVYKITLHNNIRVMTVRFKHNTIDIENRVVEGCL